MATSKHRLSPEVRLKRFLYTSTEEPKYITGDPEFHNSYVPEKVKVVAELLQSENPELLLNVVEIVNSENLIPRRDSLLFVLSVAACLTTSDTLKHKIYSTLLNLIKSAEDLCKFLKFYTKQQKKFGSALNKVIGAYYTKKEPFALAEEVTKNKGFHKWTHKDLIKLSHCRCESILTTVVLTYILYGLEKAKSVAEGNSEAEDIMNRLTKIDELKRCENEKRVIELIKELHCTLSRVPSFFHRSQPVWEALVPELPIRDLITYLPRLYKLGFLKANTPFQTKVVELLTNVETIRASNIHPVEVFIGLRNFEKGGKPIDPKFVHYLETTAQEKEKEDPSFKKPELTRETPKCPNVISALHKGMQISFQNPQPTGRKIMITIDVNDKMLGPCLNNRNLSCLDAATILTLSLLRVERDVTVAVFNDTKITPVSLEKNITFNQALNKLKQAKSGYAMNSSVFDWALSKKKQIDIFINLLYYHHWFLLIPKELRDKEKPIENLNKYRRKMSLPHTKLITFSLSSPQLSVADGSANILDICGFSKEVPKIVEAFGKGLFY